MSEIGNRYGKLIVLSQAESGGWHKRWLCKCDCGVEKAIWQISLRRGTTRSCGCHRRAINKKRWAEFQKDGKGFWARVDKSGGKDACWPWIGTGDPSEYGKTSHKGKKIKAHRLAWFLTHGSLDPNAVLRHQCDNKACCNPKHIKVGTQLENIADMVRTGLLKKNQNKGTKNGRAKLNYDAAECIRRAYGEGLSQVLIARIFGVSQESISKVLSFHRYAEPET